MTIQVAAIDMDETLLGEDGKVSPCTAEVLQRWLASGRRLVIATGRPTRMIAEALPDFLHEVPWITYNGAEVHEAGQRIFCDLLTPELSQAIVKHLQREIPDCGIGLEVDGQLHLNRPTEKAKRYTISDPSTLYDRAAAKILCFGAEAVLLRAVLAVPMHGARVLLSDKVHFAQIMSITADKAHALEFVVNRWGLSLDHVVAFGDDVNDVEMVRLSGIGVAVENAVEPVKAVAKRIAPHHRDNGVAHVLCEFL